MPTAGVQKHCPEHGRPAPTKRGKGRRKGSRPVYAERICDNPECKTPYIPAAAPQRYCTKIACRRYRNRILAKSFRSTVTGRVCRWCKRTDSETLFRGADCANCFERGKANGYCENPSGRCRGRPLLKMQDGPVYCEICSPVRVPDRFIKVRLACGGVFKIVHKSPTVTIRVKGVMTSFGVLQKRAGNRLLTVLLDKRSFVFEHTRFPIAVLGGEIPEWPYGLGLMPEKVLGDLYDICHFIQLGEANPMTFEWYWQKYKEGATHNTAARSWERLKKRLRDYGVPFTLVFGETGEAEPGVKGSMAMQFPKDFVPAVRAAVRSREGP